MNKDFEKALTAISNGAARQSCMFVKEGPRTYIPDKVRMKKIKAGKTLPRIKDMSPKAKIDPEVVAKALGAEVVEPKGKMLDWIRRAAFWLPSLRGKH